MLSVARVIQKSSGIPVCQTPIREVAKDGHKNSATGTGSNLSRNHLPTGYAFRVMCF